MPEQLLSSDYRGPWTEWTGCHRLHVPSQRYALVDEDGEHLIDIEVENIDNVQFA